MKRHLTILSAAAAVVIALTVSGCGGPSAAGAGEPGASEVKELRYQGWANTVTLPELAEDLGYLGDVKLNWVGNTISGPQDIQSAATGQTEPNQLVLFDNRITQHYAPDNYDGQPRKLNRVTIAGDIPVSVDGTQSQPLKGDSSTYSELAPLS